MHTLLIVGDVRLYTDGLAYLLGKRDTIRTLGTAAGLDEAAAVIRAGSPDVILVDIAMRGSLRMVEQLAALAPESSIIALTLPEADAAVLACAEAGVAGYVTRDSTAEELIAVIESAAVGEVQCPPRVVGTLFRRISKLATRQRQRGFDALTARKLAVLRRIEQGFCNKDIASDLGIELSTVKNHVHNVLDKLGVHRRGEAAALYRASTPIVDLRRRPA